MSAFCSLCQFIWIPVNLECCQVFRWIPCVFMCSFLIDQLGNVPLINSNKVYDKAVAFLVRCPRSMWLFFPFSFFGQHLFSSLTGWGWVIDSDLWFHLCHMFRYIQYILCLWLCLRLHTDPYHYSIFFITYFLEYGYCATIICLKLASSSGLMNLAFKTPILLHSFFCWFGKGYALRIESAVL